MDKYLIPLQKVRFDFMAYPKWGKAINYDNWGHSSEGGVSPYLKQMGDLVQIIAILFMLSVGNNFSLNQEIDFMQWNHNKIRLKGKDRSG